MNFLEKLRNHTAPMHEALEQNSYSTALMSNSVTVEDYRNYLEKMYGFLISFEDVVFPMVRHIFPDIEEKQKADLLADDITKLGGNISEIPVFNRARMAGMYADIASALGGLYVMEGSTLGGMVINNHLVKYIGEAVQGKTSYFTVYGQKTATNWRSFLTEFTNAAEALPNSEKVIEASADTFETLNEWMQ